MSWITAMATTVTTTPVFATGVAWARPRGGRSALRTAAFTAAAALAASRFGLPVLGMAPSHLAAVNTGLTSLATVTALLWLVRLAPRALRTTARLLLSRTPRTRTAVASPRTVAPAGTGELGHHGNPDRFAQQGAQSRTGFGSRRGEVAYRDGQPITNLVDPRDPAVAALIERSPRN